MDADDFELTIPSALKPIEVYVDEQGRTVTRYPAAWAEGATPDVTAKPRARRKQQE